MRQSLETHTQKETIRISLGAENTKEEVDVSHPIWYKLWKAWMKAGNEYYEHAGIKTVNL